MSETKMDTYVSKLLKLNEVAILTEATSPEAKVLADTLARMFLGDAGVAISGAQKQLDAWKSKNGNSYNSPEDFNADFDRLYTKFLTLIKSI